MDDEGRAVIEESKAKGRYPQSLYSEEQMQKVSGKFTNSLQERERGGRQWRLKRKQGAGGGRRRRNSDVDESLWKMS